MLPHVLGAVDKTSSSFSAQGKIGNFIIIKFQLGGLGSAVSSRSGVWCKAPADKRFDAYWSQKELLRAALVAAGFIQCFDTVGLVTCPVKIVPEMTYYVSSRTFPAHSLTHSLVAAVFVDFLRIKAIFAQNVYLGPVRQRTAPYGEFFS